MEVSEGDFVTHNGGIYLVLTNSYAHDTIATRLLNVEAMTELVVMDIDTKSDWLPLWSIDSTTKIILMSLVVAVRNLYRRAENAKKTLDQLPFS